MGAVGALKTWDDNSKEYLSRAEAGGRLRKEFGTVAGPLFGEQDPEIIFSVSTKDGSARATWSMKRWISMCFITNVYLLLKKPNNLHMMGD